MSSKLIVDIINLPPSLAPRVLGSAADFIITSQCLRTLVKVDESGQLTGDLAESWTTSEDKRTFRFLIRPNSSFSNGDPLTPQDVAHSINHPDFKKIAIHFDFSNIESVKVSGHYVEIKLKRPNFNFIDHLTQPEFGIYHASDRGGTPPSLKITSGPYRLDTATSEKYKLHKNPQLNHYGPDLIEFVSLGEKKFSALKSGQVDLALLWEDPDKRMIEDLLSTGRFDVLKPHVGFTFWITLNPNTKAFSDKKARTSFQRTLKKQFEAEFSPTMSWSSAGQLFLPGGPGRIPLDWTDRLWKSKFSRQSLSGTVIRGLVSKSFQFSRALEAALKKTAGELGASLEMRTYANQHEFLDLLKSGEWDFYLINNDFSSYELLQNMVVTFNKDKPLIIFAKGQSRESTLWTSIQNEEISAERHHKTEALARELLDDGLIVPLVYKEVPIIKRKEIDLSKWSTLFPEFAFWKVRIADH